MAQPAQKAAETRKAPTLTPEQRAKQTAFERVLYDMSHNDQVISDIMLGRRIAFYELRGEIGTGNFSQVKLGVHALTKGETIGVLNDFTLSGHAKGESQFSVLPLTPSP